ncbi:uncharacterized protein J8A68_000918 [[Candida] subhashii]|uniref:Zn(2)-C6 fungal-type domain-containing protein n=1 Tax=[Candida] subhashii TaxID=561895 RepID=A0A8J5QRT6_9ASCO|nr:uncharacterized protein J8A68_000918 [[Candida] subhashii]KAG7665516.1 hypothetical protein J8A68_000918 [[Candida] subhashii]
MSEVTKGISKPATTATATTTSAATATTMPSKPSTNLNSSTPRPKGRPRVFPVAQRKKVSRACDLCKQRKMKCNGALPCLFCKSKSLNCSYLKVDGRSLKSKAYIEAQQKQNQQSQTSTLPQSQISTLPLPQGSPTSQVIAPDAQSPLGPSPISSLLINNRTPIGSTPISPLTTRRLSVHESQLPSLMNKPNTNGMKIEKPKRAASITASSPKVSGVVPIMGTNATPLTKSNTIDSVLTNSSTSSTNTGMSTAPTSNNRQSPPQVSLSVICRSLQHALVDDTHNGNSIDKIKTALNLSRGTQSEGLSNLNGQHTRILYNQTGDMRFFGESSALSLLSECRSLFYDTLGPSTFTNDPRQEYIIDESSDYTKPTLPMQLPPKDIALILIDMFQRDINDTFYVFNMKYFMNQIVEPIYANPYKANTRKLCLLHLVFAIGTLFVEYSPEINLDLPSSEEFLAGAQTLMRDNVYDGKLWMVEANFLKYFYYQACCNRSSSWMALGIAIRAAQALGLHRRVINSRFADRAIANHRRRLWRSLFVCDCVSSVNLGRPLLVSGYDYDDANCEIQEDDIEDEERIRIMCQKATSDSAIINGRIVENIFKDGRINIKRAHLLALELKLWSIQLPQELQLTSALEKQLESGANGNNYLLVFVHIGQLYGIMALTRPFLVYVVTRKLKPETKSQVKDEHSLMSFCKACIKASFLVIKLLKFYTVHNNYRKEVFTIQSACFFASIILGFTLLEQKNSAKPDLHYMGVLEEAIKDGIDILSTYAGFNNTCKRWCQHLENMMIALNCEEGVDESCASSISSEVEQFNHEIVSWNIENKALEELLNFQQYFVPVDVTTQDNLQDLLNINSNDYLNAFKYDNRDHIVFGARQHDA